MEAHLTQLPDAGTRYIALQQQLTAVTEAQTHAVLLHHDKVAGLLTQRYTEILGKMGEIEVNAALRHGEPQISK